MANLILGQDVAKKRKRIESCSYSGQILSPIASCKNPSLRFSKLISTPLDIPIHMYNFIEVFQGKALKIMSTKLQRNVVSLAKWKYLIFFKTKFIQQDMCINDPLCRSTVPAMAIIIFIFKIVIKSGAWRTDDTWVVVTIGSAEWINIF